MSAIIAPLAVGASTGLIAAWLSSGAPIPRVIGPRPPAGGAVTVALPPGAEAGAGVGAGAVPPTGVGLREAAFFPGGFRGRWVRRGNRWWFVTDDGRTLGPFEDRGRGPPPFAMDMGMDRDRGRGLGLDMGMGVGGGGPIPAGLDDKFITFVTRPYFNIPNAAMVYDTVARRGDIVDVGTNIAGLPQIRSLMPAPGSYMAQFVSAQMGMSSIAAARAAGANVMGWDLEAGAGFTPQNELNNIPMLLQQYSSAAHMAGMRFWVAPSAAVARQYAGTIARYADVIDLQGGGILAQSVQAYVDYYNQVVPQIRAVNPQALIVAQVTTTRGLSLQQLQQAFRGVARIVDGVTIWSSNATIAQAGQFLTWFRNNYSRRGGMGPRQMMMPSPMMLGPPQWFINQQMRMERQMLREQVTVMHVEALRTDLENLAARENVLVMARQGAAGAGLSVAQVDPAVIPRLQETASRLNLLEARLEAAGITQNIQILDPATTTWLRAVAPRLRALRLRLDELRLRLLGRAQAERERAMDITEKARLVAARARARAARLRASRAAARGRAAIRRAHRPHHRRQG